MAYTIRTYRKPSLTHTPHVLRHPRGHAGVETIKRVGRRGCAACHVRAAGGRVTRVASPVTYEEKGATTSGKTMRQRQVQLQLARTAKRRPGGQSRARAEEEESAPNTQANTV